MAASSGTAVTHLAARFHPALGEVLAKRLILTVGSGLGSPESAISHSHCTVHLGRRTNSTQLLLIRMPSCSQPTCSSASPPSSPLTAAGGSQQELGEPQQLNGLRCSHKSRCLSLQNPKSLIHNEVTGLVIDTQH